MKHLPLPSQERLHEVFSYSPITGELTWQNLPIDLVYLNGQQAGFMTDRGWRRIRLDGKQYRAARLVWCWVTGEDPGDLTVDHIDRCRDNQAWHNLRLADRKQQRANRGR